jgi:hypothetical protein
VVKAETYPFTTFARLFAQGDTHGSGWFPFVFQHATKGNAGDKRGTRDAIPKESKGKDENKKAPNFENQRLSVVLACAC